MAQNNHPNILLVIRDNNFRHMVKVTLDLSYDYGLIQCKTSNEALNKLIGGTSKSTKFIIYEYVSGDFSFSDLVQRVSNKHPGTRILLIIDKVEKAQAEFSKFPFITIIGKDVFLKEFNQIFKILLREDKDKEEEYKRVQIDTLAYLDGVVSDAYVKIASGKFIKLVSKGDFISQDEIHRYKAQDIHYVYMKKEFSDQVIGQMSKQVDFFLKHPGFKFIIRSKDDPLHKRFEQKILRCADDFLIDQDFQKQLEGVIGKTVESINRIPKMETLLKKIQSTNKTHHYLPEHMLLLCYITAAWSDKMGWHSKGTKEKLIFASVLHDVTLAGTPHLAEINTPAAFASKKDELSNKEKDLVMNHPLEAAHLVSSFFQLAPPDTEVIIRQHHELPNGKGWPKKVSWAKINPLSALFIVAHDYVDYVLKNDAHDINDFIEDAEQRYTQSTFASILGILKKLVTGPQ